MEHRKAVVLLVMVIGAVLLLSFNPSFTGSAISEGSIDDEMLIHDAKPGEQIKASFNLKVRDSQIVKLEVAPTGQVADWVEMPQTEFRMLPNLDHQIDFYINVPEDTELGKKRVKFVLMYVDSFDEASVLNDQILDYVTVVLDVTENTREGIQINSVEAFDAEIGEELHVLSEIQSLANERTQHSVLVEVVDGKGSVLKSDTVAVDLLAYEAQEVLVEIDGDFLPGEYEARVLIGEEVSSSRFEIHPIDRMRQEGNILAAEAEVSSEGEVIVTTYVSNEGEGILVASISGEIGELGEDTISFEEKAVEILPGDHTMFESTIDGLNVGKFDGKVELVTGNNVLDSKDLEFYTGDTVTLQANFLVIFGLVLFLLIVTHYLLVRRLR